ncbi:MAG: RNA-directed DNA polymerase [Sulfurovaceae bacterium]
MIFSLPTIKSAYKKLKSYVYEDNTLLHLRIELAEFESSGDIETKLASVIDLLKSNNIDEYLEKIGFLVLPKKIAGIEKSIKNLPILYSNRPLQEKYLVSDKDFNIFIDCPIVLHIISVLWIMFIGEKLDKELHKNICGYRLSRNKDGFFDEYGYKLFEKYHERYSYFRDSAITKAIDLHKLDLDATVVNLDIKRFFYYIKFDLTILDEIAGEYKNLNILMNKIHKKYQEVILENKILTTKTDRILPIGLLSSSVVANYALKEFDDYIVQKIKPEHYTRYVDDILMVFSNTSIASMNDLLKIFECKQNNLDFQSRCRFVFFKSGINRFIFQQGKVKILEFQRDASISLLKKFKQTIESNRSALNFLPEEKNIFSTLEDVSINIDYSSTINKVSSIDKTSLDVLQISRNLSQMIRIVLVINHKNSEVKKYNEHIKNLFAGKNLLELSKLWEKLFLYLILSRSFVLLKQIFIDILKAIDVIEYQEEHITKQLKNNLLRLLANSLLMSASLDIKTFKESVQPFIEEKTKGFYEELYNLIAIQYIEEYSKYLIEANLIRQYYIRYPLLSFTDNEKASFVDKSLVFKKLKLQVDLKKIEYSPKFIHYHEVLMYEKFIRSFATTQEIFEKYSSFNKNSPNKANYPNFDDIHSLIKTNDSFKNLKIGLANINVNPENSLDSMLGKSSISYARLNDIYQVLNSAKTTYCDMVVFPEISIPIYWLQEIVEFAKRNEIAVVLGLEHFSIQKYAYNYAVAILPFRDGAYKNVYVDFELKSHYSPEEIKLIEGNGYKIPKINKKHKEHNIKPKIYTYKDNYFSVFNCYELTDISYRSNLVAKVDFVIVIEHNKDTNYFSNIVGSVSRDIHAYIVQVNDAKYGDSRITQPSKTEEMDIAKIKGGEDVMLLTSTLDVKNLREFQKLSHILQAENKRFKLTPPKFLELCNNRRLG